MVCPVIVTPDYLGWALGRFSLSIPEKCKFVKVPKMNDDNIFIDKYFLQNIFLGIAGMIVCVGLLTLFLWKTFTTISDRREFARFEEERMKMKFNANSNPIFKQATTTIQNPMFCKEAY